MLAEHELGGDLAVALPARDEPEHLLLARGQPVRARGSAGPHQRLHPREVRRRAEPREDAAGGLQLERGRVVVPERAAGEADQRTRAGGLVGRLELLPQPRGAAEERQRGAGVAGGELDRPRRERRHRLQHGAVLAVRDLRELGAGAARLLRGAERQRDLDLGGQQPRARGRSTASPSARRIAAAARGAVPLGQPQQREAGHRLATGLARLPVGLLGRVELAAQPVDLPLQVDGLAARERVASPRRSAGPPAAPPRAPPARRREAT